MCAEVLVEVEKEMVEYGELLIDGGLAGALDNAKQIQERQKKALRKKEKAAVMN